MPMEDPRNLNWFDISRLFTGTPTQRSAARELSDLRVFELLEDYTPVLCGTVPIDCDIPGSDLDIACCVPRLLPFKEILHAEFGDKLSFECEEKNLEGIHSVVARFRAGDWSVEIVGQTVPVVRQRAFMHMLAEALLLFHKKTNAKQEIRRLKLDGLTTEEAFGKLFSLTGNPYTALSEIYLREILKAV